MKFTPIPPHARPKLSARARMQTDRLTGKPMLLYPEGALALNPTGQEVVSLCNGEMPLEEMVAKLAQRHGITVERVAPDVTKYLNELRARNLLELLESPE